MGYELSRMRSANRQIGAYEVKEEIGRGRMAIVHRAVDTRTANDVALKILLTKHLKNPAYLKRFLQEAQNAQQLRHPNIVQILDAGQAKGIHYMALELVRGETLAQKLLTYGEPLPPTRVIPIIQQVAKGLEYAHSLGFLHRDINPSNILVLGEEQAVLSDFGLAKQVFSDETTTVFTMADYSMGTPSFMSPEQARGDAKIDHRSDIYGLGVVAYCMLTGRLPFEAESQPALLYKIIYEAAPDPGTINPSIPPGVAYALKRVLAKDAPKRYRSATAFANALEEGTSWIPHSTIGAYPAALRTLATTQYNPKSSIRIPLPKAEPARPPSWAVLPILLGIVLVATTLVMLLTWENRIRGQLDSLIAAGNQTTQTNQEVSANQSAIDVKPFIAPDGAYTINVPEVWVKGVGATDESIYFDSEDTLARLFIQPFDTVHPAEPLENIAQRYVHENPLALQAIKVDAATFLQIGNSSGYEQHVSAEWLKADVIVRFIVVNNDGFGYVAGVIIDRDEQEFYEADLDAILSSFRTRQ